MADVRSKLSSALKLERLQNGARMHSPLRGELRGEIAPGPYSVLNALNSSWTGPRSGSEVPRLFLRMGLHLGSSAFAPASMERTDPGSYHGGYMEDEVAALLSVLLRARLKAGRAVWESVDSDPKGQPRADTGRPVIPEPGFSQLPFVAGQRTIAPHPLLSAYPTLQASDATALVRAARLYQDAIWIAEAEPQLAWLMLVAAVETLAVTWDSDDEDSQSNVDRWEPELAAAVREACERGADVVIGVLDRFMGRQLRATKKYVLFSLRFMPSPPDRRPEQRWLQLEWTPINLEKTLKVVYDHRSKALHRGIPFPLPMCARPFQIDGGSPSEVPMGNSTAGQGGTWVREHTPLLLHTFEYLVRGLILNWWQDRAGLQGQDLVP